MFSEFGLSLVILLVIGLLILTRPRLLMFAALLISGVLFFCGIRQKSLLLVCLSPLFLLVSLVFVVTIKAMRHQPIMPQSGFRWRVIIGISLIVLFGFGLIVLQRPWLIVLFWLAVIWLIFSLLYRNRNQGWISLQMFSLLGSAMRQNLPLTVALENAAHGRRDYLGSVLREIHAWLVQGYDLAEALERGYPQCPRHLLGTVKVASKSQQLPQAFSLLEQNLQASMCRRSLGQAGPEPYPLIILLIMYFQLMGLLTFVMPQTKGVYKELLGSFEHMPWPTRVLMDSSIGHLHFMQLIGFILVGAVLIQLLKSLRPRAWSTPGWWGTWGDWLRWHIPGTGHIERTLGMLEITSNLRLGIQGGQPVDQVIGHCLDLRVNAVLKRRLRRWHKVIVSGTTVSQAARQCHLGRALAWAFNSDLNAGRAPQILASLEALLRARHRYLSVVLRSILIPCMTIALALVVGFVIVGIFCPEVAVIHSLSGTIYP